MIDFKVRTTAEYSSLFGGHFVGEAVEFKDRGIVRIKYDKEQSDTYYAIGHEGLDDGFVCINQCWLQSVI